jgi:FKBP-type peptidyl-prolyl cis-trans isomerase FklB
MEKISYALGLSVAQNLISSGVKDLNQSAFSKGIMHGLQNENVEMTPSEVNDLLRQYFEGLQQKAVSLNKEAGQKFLAENAKNDGVTVLASGLQYQVLTEGTGAQPKATDKVKCHYHGTLIDGTVFDSSVERGTPAVFPVNGVIQGWVEALQLMQVGAKWRLFIPSELAYGDRGAGDKIGPNTTLVFDVELIEIN